jgi:hypothetical protein
MNNIAQILTVLKRIHPTAQELAKLKILIACHGSWLTKKQIKAATGLPSNCKFDFVGLARIGMVDAEKRDVVFPCHALGKVMHYRTSKQGIKYLTELMK